jgi:hypothetical protein
VWDIRTYQYKVTALKTGNMLTHMSCSARAINEYQLIFWMEMPEKEVAEVGVYHQTEGTVGGVGDFFKFGFHGAGAALFYTYFTECLIKINEKVKIIQILDRIRQALVFDFA